jgi:hypothetical protein
MHGIEWRAQNGIAIGLGIESGLGKESNFGFLPPFLCVVPFLFIPSFVKHKFVYSPKSLFMSNMQVLGSIVRRIFKILPTKNMALKKVNFPPNSRHFP